MRKLLARAGNLPIPVILVPIFLGMLVLFVTLIRQGNIQLLEPAGYIADIQSKILWAALIFAAIASITLISSFYIMVSRFKEDRQATYDPAWTGGKRVVAAAWGVPLGVIMVLSVFVWITAHQVDPYQAIGGASPITIQVVALQWKWLFIYPDDRIATVNMLEIPVNRPVAFQLTADAPMNSFWIPRLSGQIYAMTGMVTQLHIKAEKEGTFIGSPAEMSGADFAGMDFPVHVVSPETYTAWKAAVKGSGQPLNNTSFRQLARPSGYIPPQLYTVTDRNLFQAIVLSFMTPGINPNDTQIKGTAL